MLSRTTFGNWIFASGGEQNAARNVGVPVNRTKILLFMSTALAAALVGIISFTQASSAVSEQGVGYEFFYIIAAVVGGACSPAATDPRSAQRSARASSAWRSRA